MKLNEVTNKGIYFDAEDIYESPEMIYEITSNQDSLKATKWCYEFSEGKKDYYSLDSVINNIQTSDEIYDLENINTKNVNSAKRTGKFFVIEHKN